MPGSTEVLESCFGTLKALEKDQSKGGFTGLVLGLGALLGKVTKEVVAAALRQHARQGRPQLVQTRTSAPACRANASKPSASLA